MKRILCIFVGLFILISLPIFAATFVLSGDIGGTNARLRLSKLENNKRQVITSKTYRVKGYNNIINVINAFLKDYPKSSVKSVCLAIAGPIKNGKVKVTNSKWTIDTQQLQEVFKKSQIKLINDFEAIGYGIESLTKDDLRPLQKGIVKKDGLQAFIGAGTGLGVGFTTRCGSQYVVHSTEGGHTSFAPTDDLQMNILKYLHEKYKTDISSEQLLSGSGITNIYKYYRQLKPSYVKASEPKDLKDAIENERSNAPNIIHDAAFNNKYDLAVATVETFVKIYGSKAGDVAFTFLPRGGLYIVGSIAANFLMPPYDKNFMQAFANKDKLSYMLKDIPVWLVLNTDVGLLGAENYAFKLISPQNNFITMNAKPREEI